MKARRRRGLLLIALAVASGGLAAAQVHERERTVEARVGPLISVLVAARDLPADARLRPGAVTPRRVPARFVPPDALADAAEVAGARVAVALSAGSYLTAGHLRGGPAAGGAPGAGAAGAALGRGERALEVAVTGDGALGGVGPGARVDVVVSTEPRTGAGRAFVALEDVELLGLRPGEASAAIDEPAEAGTATATALATLRVTVRQAVYLTAAENFGREVRLLVRPPGDRGRSPGAVTAEADL